MMRKSWKISIAFKWIVFLAPLKCLSTDTGLNDRGVFFDDLSNKVIGLQIK